MMGQLLAATLLLISVVLHVTQATRTVYVCDEAAFTHIPGTDICYMIGPNSRTFTQSKNYCQTFTNGNILLPEYADMLWDFLGTDHDITGWHRVDGKQDGNTQTYVTRNGPVTLNLNLYATSQSGSALLIHLQLHRYSGHIARNQNAKFICQSSATETVLEDTTKKMVEPA